MPASRAKTPLHSRKSWLHAAVMAAVFAVPGSFALPGCGDGETYTPDACPPQHEYDIRELYAKDNLNDPDIARRRAAIEAEVRAAAEKGCVTKPTYTPPLD